MKTSDISYIEQGTVNMNQVKDVYIPFILILVNMLFYIPAEI